MQSDEPSLQTVLDRKYGLPGPLLAEGRFVIIDGDQGTSLVCLGLGSECLVMAAIVFYGSTIDYELQYLVPLTMVLISYRSSSHILEVRNDIGHTQVFQLCSCINKTETWDLFTSTINKVYQLNTDDGCGSMSIDLVASTIGNTSDLGMDWQNAYDFFKDSEIESSNETSTAKEIIPSDLRKECQLVPSTNKSDLGMEWQNAHDFFKDAEMESSNETSTAKEIIPSDLCKECQLVPSTNKSDLGMEWQNAHDFFKDAEIESSNETSTTEEIIPLEMSEECQCCQDVSKYPKWFQPRYTSSPNISLYTANSQNKCQIVQPLQKFEFEFEFHSIGSLGGSICTRASSINRDCELESTSDSSSEESSLDASKKSTSGKKSSRIVPRCLSPTQESSSLDAFACLSSSEEVLSSDDEEDTEEESMSYSRYKGIMFNAQDYDVDEELEFVKRFTSECDIEENDASTEERIKECNVLKARPNKKIGKRLKKFFRRYFLCCIGKK